MNWLSKILATLLVLVVNATIVSLVLNQTVLNNHYLEQQLATTNSYTRLSTALSDQVAKSVGIVDPAVSGRIATVVTPQLVQSRLNGTIDQFTAYYNGHGPVPTIDFTDIGSQLQAAGIPLGTIDGLTKPIIIGNGGVDRNTNTNPKTVQKWSIIASVVLLMLLVVICIRRKNYFILPKVLISIGIFQLLIALLWLLGAGLLAHFVKFSNDSVAFTAIIHDLIIAIAHDVGKRFAIIAVSFLGVGIIARLWLRHATTLRLKAPPSVTSPPVSPQNSAFPR